MQKPQHEQGTLHFVASITFASCCRIDTILVHALCWTTMTRMQGIGEFRSRLLFLAVVRTAQGDHGMVW